MTLILKLRYVYYVLEIILTIIKFLNFGKDINQIREVIFACKSLSQN